MGILSVDLFEPNSLFDMYGRGYPRRILIEKFGLDAHIPKTISRSVVIRDYQMAYVTTTKKYDEILCLLDSMKSGYDLLEIYEFLGIYRSGRCVPLGDIFSMFDLSDEFKQVAKSVRIQKSKQSLMDKYGVESLFALPEQQEKIKDTIREKYGVDNVFQNESIKDKIKQTNLKKYGVENPSQSPIIQQKVSDTSMEHYGVLRPTQSEKIKEKVRKTNLARRGVEFPMQSHDVQDVLRKNNLKKYGVAYTLQDVSVRQRANDTKHKNHTFNSSFCENDLYEMLISYFGEDDVEYQYDKDIRYPFACDFYVKSRDLFIELNGTWTHGRHWFDVNNDADISQMMLWKSKNTSYYDNAIVNWVQSDVKKRNTAKQNNLNYVVFWDGTNHSDANLWFAMGCPDGQDWNKEYSWIVNRDLSIFGSFPFLSNTPAIIAEIIYVANGYEFYKRELNLWLQNVTLTNYGRFQAKLYAVQYKQSGKLPNELTTLEILRGIGIARMVRPYSIFNNDAMIQVLKKYNVRFVYDPCVGWGERLITCAVNNVDYIGIGNDANVVDGCVRIINYYKLHNQMSIYADGSTFDMTSEQHDAVITCPFYGSNEIHNITDFENLLSTGFLKWWKNLIHNSVGRHTCVFAYQVNNEYCDVLDSVLFAAGWSLQDVIPVKPNVVNFTRNESMRVFVCNVV